MKYFNNVSIRLLTNASIDFILTAERPIDDIELPTLNGLTSETTTAYVTQEDPKYGENSEDTMTGRCFFFIVVKYMWTQK